MLSHSDMEMLVLCTVIVVLVSTVVYVVIWWLPNSVAMNWKLRRLQKQLRLIQCQVLDANWSVAAQAQRVKYAKRLREQTCQATEVS